MYVGVSPHQIDQSTHELANKCRSILAKQQMNESFEQTVKWRFDAQILIKFDKLNSLTPFCLNGIIQFLLFVGFRSMFEEMGFNGRNKKRSSTAVAMLAIIMISFTSSIIF
jgi:hypothetical protein